MTQRSYAFLLVIIAVVVLLVPFVPMVHGQGSQFPGDTGESGIVPCGDQEGPCQLCHLTALAQESLNFVIYISVFLATILIVYAGFLYITAGGDTNKISTATGIFGNVVIGIIIILIAWLVVDTIMKSFFDESDLNDPQNVPASQKFGPWNEINCVYRGAGTAPTTEPAPGTGGNVVVTTPQQPSEESYATGAGTYSEAGALDAYNRTEQWAGLLLEIGQEEGLSLESIDTGRAQMMIESRGNATIRGQAGEIGLMQILPSTAVQIDPSLQDFSPLALETYLQDPENNIRLWAKDFKRVYEQTGSNDLAAAHHNGGNGAIAPSRDCPGDVAFRCHINQGGYTITEQYVNNVNQLREYVKTGDLPTS